jgi:hypothetical protein
MLSAQLEDFVKHTETSDSVDIHTLAKGSVLSIETQNTMFTMVIVEPENAVVVVSALQPKLLEPMICSFQGATDGGSAVKIGHIVVGMMMQMNPSRGLMITSRVKEFSIVNNREISERYLEIWNQEQQKPAFDENEFNAKVTDLAKKEFAGEDQNRVLQILSQFNYEGKGIMLGILCKAKKAYKLPRAFEVISKYFKAHWIFRPPSMRGSFITPADIQCVHDMYHELGLELPQEEE